MRKVAKASGRPSETFVPRSFDNHLDSEPVRVILRSATLGDRTAIRMDMGADQSNSRAAELLIKRLVARVENYTDAGGSPIKTGEDLWLLGEPEIVIEVGARCIQHLGLNDLEQPSSGGRPASGSSETPASAGTAGTAEPRASTSHEAAE